MIEAPELMTADELLAYEAPNKRVELVRGQLIVREPPGSLHGSVIFELSVAIGTYLRDTNPRAGRAFAGDTGFWIVRDPDTVRAPDFAYVRSERLENGVVPVGYLKFGPDLAVEVSSPTDRTGAVLQKTGQWLEAGCELVWVIDPQRRSAQVYAADGSIALLDEDDALDGAGVLPGFRVRLGDLWSDITADV
jgi:Uma2 family endonuclease